jgi:probable HAF family extracellular repeat protein
MNRFYPVNDTFTGGANMKAIDTRRIRGFILAASLGIGMGFVAPASAGESFLIDLNSGKVTALANPFGVYDTHAYGLNDAGQVVGGAETAGREYHAFITGPNGVGMTDLKSPSGTQAYGINDAGWVVGEANFPNFHGAPHAFITGPNGAGMTDLGSQAGYYYSGANGINAAGQVAGVFYNPVADQSQAFITGPNGVGMTDLGTLGGNASWATGINDAGQVIGYADTAAAESHAFITGPNGVGMTDLGTLGGSASVATGINDVGQVTGYSDTAAGESHAFITGPNGVGMTDLGTLGGSTSWANDINDAGQVVGYSNPVGFPAYQHNAFVTGPNGVGMTDLNSLVGLPGVVLSEASAINNMGQVIAYSYSLSPIPEPQTYALMLAGLFLTGVMVRRKQKG